MHAWLKTRAEVHDLYRTEVKLLSSVAQILDHEHIIESIWITFVSWST